MPLFKVPLIGKEGLMSDLPLAELPAGVMTSFKNVRCRDQLIELVSGYSELSNGTALSFAPYFLVYSAETLGYWLLCGLNKVYASYLGTGSWADVTRTASNYAATADERWCGGVLNGVVVISNGIDAPQVWTRPSTTIKLVDLPNWPADHVCRAIRPFKNYLVALNITDNTNPLLPYPYPHMVKWSQPADPGTYPDSWDETDATKDAGEFDLPGSDHIVDGGALRDFFVVYKDRSTHLMQFIGGRYIFKFSQVFTESGIMAKNCWTELDGQHVVFTTSDLITHNGVSAESLLNGRMRRWLFRNIDTGYMDRSFVVKNWFYNELWFCFPEPGAGTCTLALVWNWKDNVISMRDLPGVTHGDLGPITAPAEQTWASDDTSWASDDVAWNAANYSPIEQRLVMTAPATEQFMLMDSTTEFDGSTIIGEVIRSGLTFDAPERRKLVRGIRPRFYSAGNAVTITVGGQEDLHGDITWGDAQTFTIGTSYKTDHLVEGRYIAFKLSSATDFWRLESLDFDIEMLGEY